MLAAALPLLFDSGTDAQIAAYADPWLARSPKCATRSGCPRTSRASATVAQTDPKAALAEIGANTAAQSVLSDSSSTRSNWNCSCSPLHDLGLLPRVQQLAFSLGPDAGQLGRHPPR